MRHGGTFYFSLSHCSRAHQHIREAGQATNFAQKDSRMFWRGVTWTSPDRTELMEKTRGRGDVADIVAIEWKSPNDPAPNGFVSGTEMCAWKYIIYTEGILIHGSRSNGRNLV